MQPEFIFDFGSPNAYLAHKVIGDIETRTGVKFAYIPCLLGGIFKATNNQAPMIAFGDIKNKMDYESLEMRRFIERHGLTAFTFNPHFPVNTLLLMRGAIAAEQMGVLDRYIDAGLHHMWEAPKKMDDPEVYAAAMTASGLDGDALLAATQDPDVKAKLVANTSAVVDRGTFGIPTFFVGDEIFFGKERLGQVEEEIARQI